MTAVLQLPPGVLANDVLTRPVLAAPLPHSHISKVTIWVRKMQNSCILLPLGLLRWKVCDWQLLTGKSLGIFLDFLKSMVWFECSGCSSTCLLHNKFPQVQKKKRKHSLGHWEDTTGMKMSGGFSQSGSRMSQQGNVDDRRTDCDLQTLKELKWQEWEK